MSTFPRLERNEALPIVNLYFKDSFPVSPEILQNIHAWFAGVCQVELKESDFYSVTSGSNNISLDVDDFHLQYLSIDLVRILGRRGSVCNKVAREIICGGNTAWYQRDGKYKAHHEFKRTNKKSHTKEKAKQKRLESNTTAVITMRAAHVNNTRVHITSRSLSLHQLVHLQDGSE